MKTIGLLGGMSWESTALYYRLINEEVRNRLGGLHSAQIAMYSVDFEPIERLQYAGNWSSAAEILIKAARGIRAAGANFLVICTNTMHRVAPEIEAAAGIPVLHIADATGQALVQSGIRRVGLLGTAFTMEQPFYRQRLSEQYGLEVLVPGPEDRRRVHDVIYRELCAGITAPDSRAAYVRIMDDLAARGAEAVILGCTEIGILVSQEDTRVPLFDTTVIHARAAVARALQDHPAAATD